MATTTADLVAQLQSHGVFGGRKRRQAAEALAADGSRRAVAALASALASGGDGHVCSIAREALGALTDQDAVDAVCAVWAETRSPALAELVVSNEI
jgi:HEAT repeat protein